MAAIIRAKEAAKLRTGRPLRFSSFPVCVCQPADQTRTSGLRRLGKRLAHGLAQVRAQSGARRIVSAGFSCAPPSGGPRLE